MAGTKLGIKVGRPDNREFLLYAILNDFWGGGYYMCFFRKHYKACGGC